MQRIKLSQYQNFALLYQKPLIEYLVPILPPKGGPAMAFREEKGKPSHLLKSRSLTKIKELENFSFSGALLSQQCQLQLEIAAALLPDGYWRCREYSCHQDLAIGLGTPSFYENGIQLHHLYGFPYLPASSIKGAVRHWTIYRYFDNSEKEALKDVDFCLLFGDTADEEEKDYPNMGRGQIIFWDAFPSQAPQLKVDILNTHFQHYYGGKSAPTDTRNPIPVYFLTVADGATFQLLLGQQKASLLQNALAVQLPIEDKTLLHAAHFLMEECFDQWGIGAKTALGYGRLRPVKD